MIRHFLLLLLLIGSYSCSKVEQDEAGSGEGSGSVADASDRYYPVVQSEGFPAADEQGNIIPDFSRVGYRWGDQSIPDVPVVETLEAPADGSDAHTLIQQAIDRVSSLPLTGRWRGAILLKKGVYNISASLKIQESGIVLRGEGYDANGTVLVATGKSQYNLIVFSSGTTRMIPSSPTGSIMNVKEDYVPVGRFWVTVTDPQRFSVGDQVILYRPASEQWISDIRMDQIEEREGTVQWDPQQYVVKMERVITMICGDTLHFDNPCVMALERKYGGGAVYKYRYEKRLEECGVENMLLRSYYASDTDEDHGWSAIEMKTVEHSWVRDVHSEYFGFGLVTIASSSKNITVADCECREAKSVITGSRRYSFNVNGSLNLVIGCRAFDGRHDYVTGSRQAGTNAFVRCTARRTHADIGPHQRWNMGTLYDNIDTDGEINVQDRQYYGTGHGWAGANQVLWNCTADRVAVQSPWASAKNYSIGTIGQKTPGDFRTPERPDGVWIAAGRHVDPGSLYEAQLELRRSKYPGGIFSIDR